MAKPATKPVTDPKQQVANLERELRLRDERIQELKDEIDESRELVREMEEHTQEHAEYLETFISAFGLTLNAEGKWENGDFIAGYRALVDQYENLRGRYNKLVGDFSRYAVPPQPVGRPIAASEAQQAQIIKHHKTGRSTRWIAEELTLSRRTVTTIVDKLDGTDRTTTKRRQRLGLEPKRKDWRPAAMDRLAKRATEHFEKGRELTKAAKGLK
jgi:hypothetical protein